MKPLPVPAVTQTGRIPCLVLALHFLVIAAANAAEPASTQRPPTANSPLNALDRYVHALDPAYGWKVNGTLRAQGSVAHFIELTSQTWLTTNEVDRPVWKHWLVVIRPEQLQADTALLFIGGGNNRDPRTPRVSGDLARVARDSGSMVVELRTVPNQPLVFNGDGVDRVEDDLIAYTWDKFLRTGDERWPARLPMTKAAVRAMDAISEFSRTEAGGGKAIEKFVVAGGSKRGWTTWTTAAVDKRVVAICPIVIDVLNVEASMLHHYRAYGFWAPAVGDYVAHGVMDWMKKPEMAALMKLEDPFTYRERLTLPKLIMNASGDQFFLPDSAQFYFDELPGTKYLRYVPNADHSLKGSDAYETLLAWHDAILRKRDLPRFTWTHGTPGQLEVRTQDRPVEARLWQATNPNARDFRLETIGPAWQSTTLTASEGAMHKVQVAQPEKGWTAYFVELTYDLGGPARLKLTTDVRVTPDTLPFEEPTPGRPK